MHILVRPLTPYPDSAWQVSLDRQKVTFRSEAEARAFADSFRVELLETHPPDHWRVGRAYLRLASPWDDFEACTPQALADLETGLGVYQVALPPDHGWTLLTEGRQALCLLRLGRGAEAEPIFRRVLPLMAAESNPNTLVMETFAGEFAAHLESTGREAEAAEVRSRWGGDAEGVPGGP